MQNSQRDKTSPLHVYQRFHPQKNLLTKFLIAWRVGQRSPCWLLCPRDFFAKYVPVWTAKTDFRKNILCKPRTIGNVVTGIQKDSTSPSTKGHTPTHLANKSIHCQATMCSPQWSTAQSISRSTKSIERLTCLAAAIHIRLNYTTILQSRRSKLKQNNRISIHVGLYYITCWYPAQKFSRRNFG